MAKSTVTLCLFDQEEGCATVDNEQLRPLSWRSDPLTNHSDWTIEIVHGESSDEPTMLHSSSYHVHKAILGVGPRRCDYFATLFQTQANVTEKLCSASRIALIEPLATVFPLLLDFCYDLDSSQNILIERATDAVALRNIANYFGCEALRKHVNNFIENDIATSHLEKSPMYWTLASMHSDVVLAESARRICAEHVEELEDEDILQLPVDLFRELVLSPYLKCHSEALGWIVADFLQRRLDTITVELVLELTKAEVLPHIDHEEALAFFQVLRHLQPTPEEWLQLESLCQRCGMALAREMEWASWDSEQERHVLLQQWANSNAITSKESVDFSPTTEEDKYDSIETTKPRATNCPHAGSSPKISLDQALLTELWILVGRLSASLVEAQRVYHSELLAEREDLQMQKQMLEAQFESQLKQLQHVNHRQMRKFHQEQHQFSISMNPAKLSKVTPSCPSCVRAKLPMVSPCSKGDTKSMDQM